MTEPAGTSIALDAQRVVLRGPAVGEVVVAIGIESVAAQFRHSPPTGAEIEAAIDRIEDALMATRLGQGHRGTLTSSSLLLRALPGLAGPGASLGLHEVEALFGRMAAASSGPSSVLGELPADRATAATLLILRETLHHLGFDRIELAHGA